MFTSNSAEETHAFALEAGARARRGDVFALTGDLGAGKTQFVKGFVAGAGGDATVTSPTFTLVHEYGGASFPIYHFDFYRVETADAVLAIGWDEYTAGDGVCIVEWADRFRELLPDNTRWLAFRVTGDHTRVIEELASP